jgi:prevent-host-death family protein
MAKIKFKYLEPVAATKAKTLFGEMLHETSVEGRRFVVNRQGKPVSVILSYKEYMELVEAKKKK